MNAPGLIVVGSGPAGVSAAEAFRKNNSTDQVRILTSDPALPYARPPLSKDFLRGEAETADTELNPATWFDDQGVELVVCDDVDGIDLADRSVIAGGVRHPYRWLILACGSRPTPPPVPGGTSALLLRSQADAVRLRDAAQSADSAVVIGAGFIGCEAAASLAMRGVATTLVAPDPCLRPNGSVTQQANASRKWSPTRVPAMSAGYRSKPSRTAPCDWTTVYRSIATWCWRPPV